MSDPTPPLGSPAQYRTDQMISAIHVNIAQDIMQITHDKAYIYLDAWRQHIEKRGYWVGPASLLCTILLTLSTADFKDKFNVTKDQWFALFSVAAVLTSIWLVVTVINAIRYRRETVGVVLDRFKNMPPVKEEPGIVGEVVQILGQIFSFRGRQ